MIDGLILMPLVIMTPLLGAIIAFLLPRRAFEVALVTSIATTGLVAALALTSNGALRHTVGGWGAPLGIDLVLDGLSLLMLLLTALVGIAITVYARGYFLPSGDDSAEQHRYDYFWSLWLFLWASLNALFLSGDVFNLYVTLELLGFSAVSLTALAGKPAVLKAAMRYLMVSLSGSLMYLMGVVFLYGGYGTLDIALLGEQVTATPALAVSAALITVGLVMKTALFPLHFWLPPAHANASAPVSALLSALVVKGSFYILIRLWLEVLYPLSDTIVPQVLSLLGAGAILWGSVQAIRQARLKLLVAYSTVAQLGYLFLLIPVMLSDRANPTALAGIVCFVIAHATAKAAAFLSAGSILYATDDDRISSLDGLLRTLPLTVTTFALAGVSLVALPPSGGFVAKWLLLDSALTQGQWGVVAVIIAGGLLAAVYIMRVVARLFRQDGYPNGEGDGDPNAQANGGEAVAALHVPYSMSVPAFALALLAILLGFVGVYLLDVLAIGTPWMLEGGV